MQPLPVNITIERGLINITRCNEGQDALLVRVRLRLRRPIPTVESSPLQRASVPGSGVREMTSGVMVTE